MSAFISRAMFDTEQLIFEVKNRPILWDPTHQQFNQRQPTLAAWDDVAANLFVDWSCFSKYEKFGKVRDIQKRWNGIKDNYIRDLKYEKKVKKGLALPKKKSVYSHQLDFLSSKEINKKSRSSDQSNCSDQEFEAEKNQTILQNNINYLAKKGIVCNVSETNHDSNTQIQSYSPVQYNHSNNAERTEDSFSGYAVAGPLTPLEQDDDKMFLLSLLPYFKKLNEEQKLQARIDVAKVLQTMLYKSS